MKQVEFLTYAGSRSDAKECMDGDGTAGTFTAEVGGKWRLEQRDTFRGVVFGSSNVSEQDIDHNV